LSMIDGLKLRLSEASGIDNNQTAPMRRGCSASLVPITD
jgi:hypothetical protein